MFAIIRIITIASLLSACVFAPQSDSPKRKSITLNSPLILDQSDCFNPALDYATWIQEFMGERASEDFRQRIEHDFPATTYEDYRKNLVCKRFIYHVDGLNIEGFYAAPKQVSEDIPAIVFNRGGNASFGNIHQGTMIRHILPLAKKGFFVIASQYRGSSPIENNGSDEFGGKDINDVLALLNIIDEVEGVDSKHIGLYGQSRGGFMSFLAAKNSPRFSAIAVLGAPTDLWAEQQSGVRPEMEQNVFSKRIPDYATNKQQALIDRSVVYWPDQLQSKAPILILHGNKDKNVRVDNALNLAAKLQSADHPYKLIIYDDGNHGLSQQHHEVLREIADWFRKHLYPVNVSD